MNMEMKLPVEYIYSLRFIYEKIIFNYYNVLAPNLRHIIPSNCIYWFKIAQNGMYGERK